MVALHSSTAMRVLLPLTMVLSTGCMAYLKADQTPRSSPRAEAGEIAMGGAAQVIVGALVAVGSYYLYQASDPPMVEDQLTGRHAGVAGVLLGGGLVVGGVADATIALYQLLSGDHLLSSSADSTSPPPSSALWPPSSPPPPAETPSLDSPRPLHSMPPENP